MTKPRTRLPHKQRPFRPTVIHRPSAAPRRSAITETVENTLPRTQREKDTHTHTRRDRRLQSPSAKILSGTGSATPVKGLRPLDPEARAWRCTHRVNIRVLCLQRHMLESGLGRSEPRTGNLWESCQPECGKTRTQATVGPLRRRRPTGPPSPQCHQCRGTRGGVARPCSARSRLRISGSGARIWIQSHRRVHRNWPGS
jgi:hypothetical protein